MINSNLDMAYSVRGRPYSVRINDWEFLFEFCSLGNLFVRFLFLFVFWWLSLASFYFTFVCLITCTCICLNSPTRPRLNYLKLAFSHPGQLCKRSCMYASQGKQNTCWHFPHTDGA